VGALRFCRVPCLSSKVSGTPAGVHWLSLRKHQFKVYILSGVVQDEISIVCFSRPLGCQPGHVRLFLFPKHVLHHLFGD